MFNRLHKRLSSSSANLRDAAVASSSAEPPPYYTLQVDAKDPLTATDKYQPTTTNLDPRYLYYRIYAPDGAIISMSPAPDVNDPYIGRIFTTSVPPPHDVLSLKRCLSHFEVVDDHSNTKLFISPGSQSAMNDTKSLSLLGSIGPGLSPQEPMAFVVKGHSEQVKLSVSDGPTMPYSRYVYYHVYNESHEIVSKNPVNDSNLTIGRIDINHVAPPRTALSLKRCLCELEEDGKDKYSKLFLNMASKSPMDDDQLFSNEKTHPGSTLHDPMVLVLSNLNPAFTKTIRATRGDYQRVREAGWLSYERDEKFRTDGILRQHTHPLHGDTLWDVYEAQNGAGYIGFVYEGWMEFC